MTYKQTKLIYIGQRVIVNKGEDKGLECEIVRISSEREPRIVAKILDISKAKGTVLTFGMGAGREVPVKWLNYRDFDLVVK